ncbi:hypothetical protein F443_03841 [Phytophthora nicotianae P1569]|uniref:Uncharacterized protein n=1 Tax=Phytophthora nicotianae P1569 TaxID=1317065 RepID=V9FQU7_PHYNI|nr:hypothetical protein F443_03841 [Phytophthora nicotianae P1569]
MVQRSTKIEPALNSLDHGTLVEYGIQTLLLQKPESERAHELLEVLADFEGVTKTLQRSTLTLSGVRRLFDLVCQRYHQLQPRLSPTATIVNYVGWRLEETSSTQAAQLSLVQQAFKKRKVSKRSLYDDVAFIPRTSNESVKGTFRR